MEGCEVQKVCRSLLSKPIKAIHAVSDDRDAAASTVETFPLRFHPFWRLSYDNPAVGRAVVAALFVHVDVVV